MIKIQENVNLKNHSTFRLGGRAKFFVEVETENDLLEALSWAKSSKSKVFFLGGGSNTLFADEGFSGLIIKLVGREIEILNEDKESLEIICQSGTFLNELVNLVASKGYAGLEWAAGIPGTVGGAVRGNAGAFGGEMKDCLVKVFVFDLFKFNEFENIDQKTARDNFLMELKKDQCQFGYRESFFKKNKDLLIWRCQMKFSKGDITEIREKIEKYLAQRKEKQPMLGEFPSAGSTFKNPIVTDKSLLKLFEKEKGQKSKEGKLPAGWLIEKAGLKGFKIGQAQVSPLQANFIVNLGGATTGEIIEMIKKVETEVEKKLGVKLEREIEVVES